MPSPFIGVRIPQDLHDALQKYVAESGEKASQVIQKALAQYLNYTHPADSRLGLEQRIESLEVSVKILTEAIAQIQKESDQKPKREKEFIPAGQLSFLDGKN